MNIFYLSNDPRKCAEYHVDKHVVKMILEYAQLLSTTHRILDTNLESSMDDNLYKATHRNHPSAIWVRQSASNYRWLYTLWLELLDEYTFRYGKQHASGRLIDHLANLPKNISTMAQFTEPTPAMPDQYKVAGDSAQSYHNYYNGDKRRMFAWKNRDVPYFITGEL